jgi:hypothetical protein
VSYPQPHSSKSVLNGQEFFRLYTPIDSNGDIYEIDTSIKAIVIGPNSDIQNARVYYADEQEPSSIATALISVNDPFVTRMNALMASEYSLLGTEKRILVSSDDIVPHPGQFFVDPTADSVDEADLVVWHRPYLDLLCYHRDPPGLPATRAERQWQHSVTIYDRGEGEGASYYFFPHYRRKYFHCRFTNPTGDTFNYSVWGGTFHAFASVGGKEFPRLVTPILAEGTIPSIPVGTHVVLYSDRVEDIASPGTHPIGYFDYMCVKVFGDALDGGEGTGISMEVIVSDWA